MGIETGISWAKSTFNPWIGCTKVSPACDHCYAEARMDSRLHVVNWGPKQPRKRTSAANWRQPLAWDKQAAATGEFWPVFCASLADVFDNEVPDEWRADLFNLIADTPNLDWLLLTKRIGNAGNMLPVPFDFDKHYPNVWIGATICNQEEADRDIPKLLATPAAVRFLSIEPMLGAVDLSPYVGYQSLTCEKCGPLSTDYAVFGATERSRWHNCEDGIRRRVTAGPTIDWVIAGGESGHGARPSHPDWFRGLRDQCAAAGVPYLFKQWGEHYPVAWFDGEDEENDDEPFFDVERRPHVFLSASGRTWDTNGGRLMYPPMPLDHWCLMGNIGKKAAGRLLDGRTHDGFPESRGRV